MSRPSPNMAVDAAAAAHDQSFHLDTDDQQRRWAVRQGKARARNLGRLPKNILRLVLTYTTASWHATPGIASAWETEHELWQSREVFVTVRVAQAALNLLLVCPPWHRALNDHPFWRMACHALDPTDLYSQLITSWVANAGGAAAAPKRVPQTAETYRILYNCFCLPCRINRPFGACGVLNHAKKWMATSHLGAAAVCREHRAHAVCGVCLRESAQLAPPDSPFEPGVVESDDEEAFPGLSATCSTCRQEALCSALECAGVLPALGGRTFDRAEYDLKLTLEAYVELAEGDAGTLAVLARERVWLREHTRMREMIAQAVAAARFADGEDADMLADEDEDEMELDVSWAEESTARELALGEWARSRILEGVWTAPADDPPLPSNQQYEAIHPAGGGTSDRRLVQPHAPVPAPGLAHALARAYYISLRAVLWPALQNVARRMLYACGDEAVAQEEANTIARDPDCARWVLERCREEKTWRHPLPPAQSQASVVPRQRSSSSSSEDHEPTSPESTSTLRTTPDGAVEPLVAHALPWVPVPDIVLNGLGPWSETRMALERCWRDASSACLWTVCSCTACVRAAGGPVPTVVPAIVPATTTTRKRGSEEMSDSEAQAVGVPGYKRQRTDSLDSNRARATADWETPPRQLQDEEEEEEEEEEDEEYEEEEQMEEVQVEVGEVAYESDDSVLRSGMQETLDEYYGIGT